MLKLTNVKKIYKTKAGNVEALDGITLTFPETGMVFVTGKSGSGKTTLLNVIGGLDGIDGGDIEIFGKKFSDFTQDEYNSYRNTLIGFIFQEYNLLPDYTIEKNVGIANELQGVKTNPEEISSVLSSVGLDNYQGRTPSQLSGGQKQRIAIARALIKNPKIIMADEPTGALDSVTGVQVLDELKRLSKEKLVIVISHDLELANTYADRIIKMVDGKVVEDVLNCDQELVGNLIESESEITVRTGSSLTDAETKTLVKAIKNKKSVKFTETLNAKRKVVTDESNIEIPDKEVKLIKSKMKFKSAATLGIKSLKVKPLRLAFTILLSAIAFTVFGVFDAIASYTRAKVIQDFLQNSDYKTVSVSAQEISSDGDRYDINLSNEAIDALSTQTGYDFKPVLRVSDYVSVNMTNPNANCDYELLKGTGEKIIAPQLGKGYYFPTINGITEFSKSERDSVDTILKGNYSLIWGKYPVLDEKKPNTVYDVAISKYLADAIMVSSNDVNSYNDFENFTLVPANVNIKAGVFPFKVVGIYDCGEIPKKFSALKDEYLTKANQPLSDELKTYLSSGVNQMLFVAEGATKKALEKLNKPMGYYSGNAVYKVENSLKQELNCADVIYSADSVLASNVIMFNEINKELENYTLDENQVLINFTDLSAIFSKELHTYGIDFNGDGQGDDYRDLDKLLYDIKLFRNDPIKMREALQKAFTLANQCMGKLGLSSTNMYRTITLNKYSGITDEKSSLNLYVVGVYYGVDVNNYDSNTVTPLVMNKKTIENVGVSLNQGYYQRVISLTKGNAKQSKALSEKITLSSGLNFSLFGNNVLAVLEDSEKQILQFTDLFLYASLALALFSAFMLFNYISASINSKRQSVGILRALGSNSSDVFNMFLTESLIISIISGIFANVFAYFACSLVNYYIKDIMNLIVNFAIFGLRQILVIFGISLLTGIISSIVPIIKIAKEKPVELIRRP